LSARFVQLAGAAVWTFAHLSDIASDRLICGNRAGWFLFCSVLDTLFSQLDCGIQGDSQTSPADSTNGGKARVFCYFRYFCILLRMQRTRLWGDGSQADFWPSWRSGVSILDYP
jgi:hypothetical protein